MRKTGKDTPYGGYTMLRDTLEGKMESKRGRGRLTIGMMSGLVGDKSYDIMKKKKAKYREECRRN